MTEAIAHRGPDDCGYWSNPSDQIFLGFKRLSIQDLSLAGHQPMISGNSRFVITSNGEIYNFHEIRRELEAEGVHFNSTSDTEVVLESISLWGLDKALQKFIGMFALALWDTVEKKLYLVRDRLGIKPLYFYCGKEMIGWASELRALYPHPQFHKDLNLDALASYLKYLYIPCPLAIFKDVVKIRQGTYVVYHKDGKLEIRTYWDPTRLLENSFKTNAAMSEEELLDEFKSLLEDSISLRMIADVPLGSFLSGGIDSSLVTSVAQSLSDKPIKTFSIGFNEKEYNEAVYAKQIAEYLGTDHTEVYVGERDVLGMIEKFVDVFCEPFGDYAGLPGLLLAQVAKRDVTVVLSGDGGDELFSGYYRYFYGPSVWNTTKKIPPVLQHVLKNLIQNTSIKTLDKCYRLVEPILPNNRRYVLPGEKLHKFASVMGAKSVEEMYRILISYWQDPLVLMKNKAKVVSYNFNNISHATFGAPDQMMHCDLITYLPDDGLTKVDRSTMAYALECRVPLLDHRMVEWSWTLPKHFRRSKHIMKRLLERYVPTKFFNHPKMGFAVPIDAWLRGPLKPMVEHYLSPKVVVREDLFDAKTVQKVWQEFLSKKQNHQYRVWALLMFQRWKERWMK